MHGNSPDERYLTWLYGQVANVRVKRKAQRHKLLLQQLHEIEFVPLVPFDENRCADGIDLRYEFLAECEDEQGDPTWTGSPCSFLEVLVVLSRILAFEMDEDAGVWFWHLIEVMELEHFTDNNYDDRAEETIARTAERVIHREYKSNGEGGLFPLRKPPSDQRKVELWYQLNAYLLELF